MVLPPQPKPKKTELVFQPVTDGLGFHPFSDGLPYAPIAKTQTSKFPQTGTGATAAGAPRFAPRISVPVARPMAVTRPAAQQPQAKAQTQAVAAMETRYGFGYCVKRIFAYLLDTIFNIALCLGALSAALWQQDINPELLFSSGMALIAALFLISFNWALTTAQEIAFGSSIGKRFFGLKLQGSTSAIFLRAFFFLPSLGFGGIGIIWALFDRRKRCWHDLVADLQPMEIAKL
jgi:uncharacterized RDD family membrane protein YckC